MDFFPSRRPPYYRCLMEHAVRNHGFRDVHLFDNGAACLDALIEEPDIISLDQMMGSVSGTDALRAVKRFNPDTCVVLVSGQQLGTWPLAAGAQWPSASSGASSGLVRGPLAPARWAAIERRLRRAVAVR